jgi:hypothetical protein
MDATVLLAKKARNVSSLSSTQSSSGSRVSGLVRSVFQINGICERTRGAEHAHADENKATRTLRRMTIVATDHA